MIRWFCRYFKYFFASNTSCIFLEFHLGIKTSPSPLPPLFGQVADGLVLLNSDNSEHRVLWDPLQVVPGITDQEWIAIPKVWQKKWMETAIPLKKAPENLPSSLWIETLHNSRCSHLSVPDQAWFPQCTTCSRLPDPKNKVKQAP